MAVNKVVVGNQVRIDLTSDTVSANALLAGRTAHLSDGTQVTGTLDFRTLTWNQLAQLTNQQ